MKVQTVAKKPSKRTKAITLKSAAELALMRDAGRIVAEVLLTLRERVGPGVTTAELDAIAERETLKRQAAPSFKGYNGFPASICVSVNEEVVHGIPSHKRILLPGDVVKLDFGASYRGWHGDSATTVVIGPPTEAVARLLTGSAGALDAAIKATGPGALVGDIGQVIHLHAVRHGLRPIGSDDLGLTGHGIGREMHEDGIVVRNFGNPGQGLRLRPGMTFTIEPMLCLGSGEAIVATDEWTVVTADHSCAAHFEHTLAVTSHGVTVMTQP